MKEYWFKKSSLTQSKVLWQSTVLGVTIWWMWIFLKLLFLSRTPPVVVLGLQREKLKPPPKEASVRTTLVLILTPYCLADGQ